MKKLVILVLATVLFVSGCATVDYFTKPENQQNLLNLGVTCFQGNDVKVGLAYIIKHTGTSVQPSTSGEFLVGCSDKWFSVVCDVTKKPNENPCSDVKEYDLKSAPAGTTFIPVTPNTPAIQ